VLLLLISIVLQWGWLGGAVSFWIRTGRNVLLLPGEMNYIYAVDEDKYGFSQIT
jgi:hypothetical protein